MTRKILSLLFVVLIAGCNKEQSDLDKVQIAELDGRSIDWRDYKGKTVLINFWATWCKPCIKEMPTLEKAQEQLQGEDIVFLYASNESVDLIENFKQKRGFDFHYVQAKNLEALNIMALPTTYIFNGEGKRFFSEAGFRDWSTAENISLIKSK